MSNVNSIARSVATLGIWGSIGWICTHALSQHWTGHLATLMLVGLIAIACASAVAGTAFVWRQATPPAPLLKTVPDPDEEWART